MLAAHSSRMHTPSGRCARGSASRVDDFTKNHQHLRAQSRSPTHILTRKPLLFARSTATLLLTFTIVGCSTSAKPADSTATATNANATAATPTVVTYNATNYKFTGPTEIPSGMTTFKLVNDGPGFHHLQIIRLDSGKTMDDFRNALEKKGPPPAWAVVVGGPNAPNPTMEANATLDMRAGNYALVCLVDMPEGVPHVAKGMLLPLSVRNAAAASAPAPAADLVMTLSDYNFQLSKPLVAGKQVIEVRSSVGQPHEVELIRLAPGKTTKDMLAWMEKMQGPPPGEGLGGVAAVVAGVPVYFSADLTPGEYVLICFVPDAKDGKPHFTKGMIQTVKVA